MTDRELPQLSQDIRALLQAEREAPPEAADRAERMLHRLTDALPAIACATTGAVAASTPHAAPQATPSAPQAGASGGLANATASAASATPLVARLAPWVVGAFVAGGAAGGAVGYRAGVRQAPPHLVPSVAWSASGGGSIPSAPNPPQLPPPSSDSATELVEAGVGVLPGSTSTPSGVSNSPTAPNASNRVAPSTTLPLPSASLTNETKDTDLALELGWVDMARTAVSRRDYAAGLRATEQHGQRFPRGRLSEERDSIAIQALVGLGRHAEARARAARFRSQYPQSLLLPIVESALRSIP